VGSQLAFRFLGSLPCRPTHRAVARHARHVLTGYATAAPVGFGVRGLADDTAQLEQWRRVRQRFYRALRRQARQSGKQLSGGAACALIRTPEGRRLEGIIEHLEARITAREGQLLCG